LNKEKLQGYFEQVKMALGKISKKIWIIIGVTVAALAIGIVIFLNTRPYATLIAGATNEEAGAVLSWLQEQGITNYRMEGTGTILVPEGQAASLKARLLVDQYSQANATPTGYFEQVSALSTQADRNRAWLMELQSRMEQTICQFPEVRSATVTINLGEDRGYVLDSNNVVEASAGVILTMQRGKALTDAQANAIRNYVAYSVAGLKVESVSLEDTEGNDYSGQSTGVGTAAASSALKLQLERQIRADFEKQILQALTPIYGENNVSVAVTVEVELGDKTINDYKVTLPPFAEDGSTEGRGIPGKQFYTYQFLTPDEGAVGGLVGTPSNSELPTYVDPGDAQAELQSILEERHETEYDNSKTQTQMVITAGTLTKVTATVGIDAKDCPNADLDAILRGSATAIGLVAPLELENGMTEQQYLSRYITVIHDEFNEPVVPEPEPSGWEALGIPLWVVIAAGAGLLVFAIVLTIILLLRGKKRKKQEAEQRAVEELLAVAMPQQTEDGVQLDENGEPVGADVMDLHTERSMELRQSIRDYVDENMEVAALLIKSWLKEDGDNG
jgi:flagellar M-ring protein FliF